MSNPPTSAVHDWHLSTNGGETKVLGVANVLLGSDDGIVRFLDATEALVFAAPTHQIIYMKRLERNVSGPRHAPDCNNGSKCGETAHCPGW